MQDGSSGALVLQILDDPSGNSFVENPHAPQRDEALVVTHYRRTPQQAAALGLEVTDQPLAPGDPRAGSSS